jgi:signal transduction histidine kinase
MDADRTEHRRRADDSEGPDADARVSSREALRFLTRAGRVLSRSLDPDETLRRLVRLAVPRVACFAMIDIVRADGPLERVAYGHIDSEKEPLLVREGPFRPGDVGLAPIQEVLESGRSILIEKVERDWTGSDEVLERIHALAGRSILIVPLVVRGETVGTLTFGSTRTDRHYHQADLSLARELGRSAGLALDNARLYRQAEQAIASRDDVLAVVSHDLRNPVSRVRMAAEMLLETGRVQESGRGTLGMVIRAADEMNRLIGDLLDVARIEAGTLSIEPGSVTIDDLMERLEESHEAAARQRKLTWSVARPVVAAADAADAPHVAGATPDEPITIHADEGRVLQALGNLVANAMKFTPAGGEVRVEAAAEGDVVRIAVRDTGPGMDPGQLAHIFDRFWQGHSGDRRGAGLGLAITRGIAEAHGGRVWIESEVGEGTTAWLELPRED